MCLVFYALGGGVSPAGEDSSRPSPIILNHPSERGGAAKHAPRDPRRLFERRHDLAEIVERGDGVIAE